jgi:hypothetical protein
VQHTDVEEPGNWRRIFGGKIADDLRSGEALAMYRHAQFVIRKGLRLARTKNVNVSGRTKLFDQFASSVMISVNKVDVDASIFQTDHLFVEKQCRFKAFESSVVEIPSNNKEIHFLGNSCIQHLLEGSPRGVANFIYRSPWILRQSLKGRV